MQLPRLHGSDRQGPLRTQRARSSLCHMDRTRLWRALAPGAAQRAFAGDLASCPGPRLYPLAGDTIVPYGIGTSAKPPRGRAATRGRVGAQAGLKALYTCTSWYAYAAMFGSSRDHGYDTTVLPYRSLLLALFCQHRGVCMLHDRERHPNFTVTNPCHLACAGTPWPSNLD